MPPAKADTSYHSFKVINRSTAMCGCGMAFMCGTSIEDQRSRHSLHIMEVERYLSEQQEQREAEAALYGDEPPWSSNPNVKLAHSPGSRTIFTLPPRRGRR